MTKTLDNIGTAMAPTWRARHRKPFTVSAVRAELVHQAAQLPEWEREGYLDERLTDLDRALDCNQAEAIERWLDCEELLQGRVRCSDYGDRVLGSGRPDPVPDEDMEALAEHAEMKRLLSVRSRKALAVLVRMTEATEWRLIPAFIRDMRHAAAELTKIARVHAQQIAHPLTKRQKSSP